MVVYEEIVVVVRRCGTVLEDTIDDSCTCSGGGFFTTMTSAARSSLHHLADVSPFLRLFIVAIVVDFFGFAGTCYLIIGPLA